MHFLRAAATFLLAVGTFAQAPSSHYDFDLTISAYEERAVDLESTHRISNIHGYVSNGKTLYTAAWEPLPANPVDRIVYVGLTNEEYRYHAAWDVSGYQVLSSNAFADEAGVDRYNLIYQKIPAGTYNQRYHTTVITRNRLAEYISEWAASKVSTPYRPLWISSWANAAGATFYNLVYGPDEENPEDYRGNIFATEIKYMQPTESFHEMIVSSALRGMSPITLTVAPLVDGTNVFTSLWRRTAEPNSYPHWSLYREIEREEMEERLADAVGKGGIVRDLIAYPKEKGGTLLYAAIVDNLPPAVLETYLPGQPVVPPRTTTTSRSSTTLSCPPSTTSSWTTTTRATTNTTTTTTTTRVTTTAKPTTTARPTTTTMTTTRKTTTTEPGWFRVTGLPAFKKVGA